MNIGPKSLKRKIDSRVRLACLATLALLLAVSIGIWYSANRLSATEQQKVNTYSYRQKGSFDYTVYLLPNSLYDTPTLEPGNTCFEKLVDYIGAVFSYEFSGTKLAEISGVYEIDANVKTKMWEKPFAVVPGTPFSTSGQSANFTVDLSLNLAKYEDIIATIEKETGVSAQDTQLVITCNINTFAQTDSGDVRTSIAPNMVIPLRQSTFEISGELSKEDNNSLVKNVEVHRSSVEDRKKYSLIPIPIVGFVLLITFFLTESKPDINGEKARANKVRREIAKAEKKYHDQIVSVTAVASPPDERVVSVGSLAELIKVADELGKPVLHLTEMEKDSYCVIDGTTRYQYISQLAESTP